MQDLTTPMFVVKRNGNNERVQFDKITKRICSLIKKDEKDILDSAIIAQKVISSIYSGITTEELDSETAKICINMVTINPLYGELAGRIAVSNLHKKTLNSFVDKMNIINEYNPGLLDQSWLKWVNNHKIELENLIDYSRDYEFDFFGFKTLERSYLIRDINTRKIYERPQDMFLRVASFICMGDIEMIKNTYDQLSNKKYIHATPTNFNAGTSRPQLSSCFLMPFVDDSITGIYDTLKNCAQISKWAGGIGLHVSNIRGKGSAIRGTNGTSNGIIPMLRVFNETARYVDQGGGKRKGSIAIYIEPHHSDILEFLDLRKNFGAETERTRDLFTALWVSDLFMEQVQNDGEWYLMCPDECKGLNEVYGEEYKQLYWKYVEENKYKKKLQARELMEKIMDSQLETGTPYITYKDHVNRKSNQKNIGIIKSSNLCVSGETYLNTLELNEHNEYYKIKELVNKEVHVWNGEEWSKTTVRKTGTNQRLRNIHFRRGNPFINGHTIGTNIYCTDYHKFYIYDENKNEKEVVASELKVGDVLYQWKDYDPAFEGDMAELHTVIINELTDIYDDTYCVNEPKRHRATFNGILTGNCNEIVEVSNKEEHAVCNLGSIALPQFLTPFKSYRSWTIYTKENCKYCRWSKKYMESKGFKFVEKTEIDEDAMKHIKKKMDCEGDSCKVGSFTYPQIFYGKQYIGGFEEMVQYTGDKYDYEALWKTAYIASSNLNRVIDKNYYPTPETQCSNMRNRPIGLGIQGLADVLANMKISYESEKALEVNSNIMETIYHASITASNDEAKHRYNMAKHMKETCDSLPEYYDKDYFVPGKTAIDDKTPIEYNNLENEYYHKLRLINRELQNLTKYYGAYSSYEGSPMSEGLFQFDMWNVKGNMYNWDELREKIMEYGVRNSLLVALMPTASTSQILGNNECFEWFTNNIYTRRTLAGDFPLVNKHLVNDLITIGEWNKDAKQMIIASDGSVKNLINIPTYYKKLYKTIWEVKQIWVLKQALARAPFVDQTQSMNIFMPVPDYKKLLSCHMWGWKNGLKTGMYYLRSKAATGAVKFTVDPNIQKRLEQEDEICESCSA